VCRQQYREAEAIIAPHVAELDAELERKNGKGKESYRLKQQRESLVSRLDALAQSLLEIEIVAQDVREEMTNRGRNSVVRRSRHAQLQAELASLQTRASRQFPLTVRLWFCGNRLSPWNVGAEKEKEVVLSLSPQPSSPPLLSPTPITFPFEDHPLIKDAPSHISSYPRSPLYIGPYTLAASLTPATNATITNFTSPIHNGSMATDATTGHSFNPTYSSTLLAPSSPGNETNTNERISSSTAWFSTSGEAIPSTVSPFSFSSQFPPPKDSHVALLPSTCADGTLYETEVVIPEGFVGSIVLLINDRGAVIWNVVDSH